MRALLIVNKGGSRDFKLLVRLEAKSLIRQVNQLIKEDRLKDVLEIFASQAEVEEFIPPGTRVHVRPDITLVEDLLM